MSAQHDPVFRKPCAVEHLEYCTSTVIVEWNTSTHFEFLGLGELVKLIVREMPTARKAIHISISEVWPSSSVTGSDTGVTERIGSHSLPVPYT